MVQVFKKNCLGNRSYDKNIISYFVDDDPDKIGKSINEIKILSYEELKELSKKINKKYNSCNTFIEKKKIELLKKYYL